MATTRPNQLTIFSLRGLMDSSSALTSGKRNRKGNTSFFTWLLVQSKLLTADNLLKRQWPCEPVCQLCSQKPETAYHLILSCCFAKEVWHKMSQWMLGFITMPSTNVLVADWWQNELAGLPKKQRRVKAALLMYTAWNLWKERNRRIFECRGAANHSRVAEGTRLSLEGVYSGVS